jgi:hypothetical protein
VTPPAAVLFRSNYRGRILYAVPGYLLEETPTHVVTATVPGAECRMLAGPRAQVLAAVAAGRERTETRAWDTTFVVWRTAFGAAHALGHFWNAETGCFLGYYVNLQAPLRRSELGFDSLDYQLDIVVEPNGVWRWKDEDELAEAVAVGVYSASEAAAVREEGERVIASLPDVLPTGWEGWRPDPSWPLLQLPNGWDRI